MCIMFIIFIIIIILLLYYYLWMLSFKINTFREDYKLLYNIEIIILFISFMIYICNLRIVILLFKDLNSNQNKDNF